MLSFRQFSDDVEALAASWRDEVVSASGWVAVGPSGPTASGAYLVRSSDGGTLGIAKPHGSTPSITVLPQAALEKVAADLAYDLGLPVPPVILWSRPDGGGPIERFVAISARAFEGATPWTIARNAGRADVARWENGLVQAASAMVPFDTWLANGDRCNGGNLVIAETPADELSVFRWAWLDFAHALPWVANDWQGARIVDIYPPDLVEDEAAIREVVGRIEALPDDRIIELVDRIPPDYLLPSQRDRLRSGLVERKSQVRTIVGRKFRTVK